VVVLPSGFQSRISRIDLDTKELNEAFAPMSVIVSLENDIDVSRGDMIVRSNNQPEPKQDIDAMICWLNDKPARPRTKFSILHTTNEQKAMIREIVYKIKIDSLERDSEDKNITMNDICRVKIRTTQPLMVDAYRENRATGSFILIDDTTNETVAAGMIL
jgi:sulfate adenylyltransferase subunit 1